MTQSIKFATLKLRHPSLLADVILDPGEYEIKGTFTTHGLHELLYWEITASGIDRRTGEPIRVRRESGVTTKLIRLIEQVDSPFELDWSYELVEYMEFGQVRKTVAARRHGSAP